MSDSAHAGARAARCARARDRPLALRSRDGLVRSGSRRAETLDFDPRTEIQGFDGSRRFETSRTSGCAAARSAAGCRGRSPTAPIYVFETGGTTGIPKSRINIDDFRIDYELFSETLPDEIVSAADRTG